MQYSIEFKEYGACATFAPGVPLLPRLPAAREERMTIAAQVGRAALGPALGSCAAMLDKVQGELAEVRSPACTGVLYTVHSMRYSVRSTVHCTLYTAHSTLYTVPLCCTVYLYSVHWGPSAAPCVCPLWFFHG